jgi:hypothetical protein
MRMKIKGATFAVTLMASLPTLAGTAAAQTQQAGSGNSPAHVSLQKTIGQPKQAVVPSLIVLSARTVTLKDNELVLTGVAPNSIIFADRPVRAAGHDLTAHVVEYWATGSGSFGSDPPNATVSAFSRDGGGVHDAVVVLKSPKLTGDQLTFAVDVLEGDLGNADGAASVFIDIIGMPWTPLSFAGAARRNAYRAAWYARAAHPYAYDPYLYRRPCGYYPYPPCY